MTPNAPYMHHVLDHYLNWQQKRFNSNFKFMNQKTQGFVKEVLDHVDHWMVAGNPHHTQFRVGYSIDDKSKSVLQSFRIFIHPNMRSHSFIKKGKLPTGFTPWFIEWNDSKTICYLGPIAEDHKSFQQICEKQGKWVEEKIEILSTQITHSWPNPFPVGIAWEIRTMKQSKIQSIFYSSTFIHISRLPRELDSVIGLHVLEAHLPLDKFSVDAAGKMTLYYP